METLVDVERDHGPVVDAGILVMQREHEEAEQHGREDLHLPVREFLSQADPWTSLESCELERALRQEHTALVEPSFGPEDNGVIAPQPLHPAHGVGCVEHDVSLADAEAIGQNVVGKALLVILKHKKTEEICSCAAQQIVMVLTWYFVLRKSSRITQSSVL